MQPTADLLGVSTADLKAQLEQGRTLSSIAADRGVSRDDLVASVREGMKAAKPAEAPDLTDPQLDRLASAVVDGRPPRPDGVGFGVNRASGLESLAGTLGMSTEDLLLKLVSGETDPLATGQKDGTYGSSTGSLSGLVVDVEA